MRRNGDAARGTCVQWKGRKAGRRACAPPGAVRRRGGARPRPSAGGVAGLPPPPASRGEGLADGAGLRRPPRVGCRELLAGAAPPGRTRLRVVLRADGPLRLRLALPAAGVVRPLGARRPPLDDALGRTGQVLPEEGEDAEGRGKTRPRRGREEGARAFRALDGLGVRHGVAGLGEVPPLLDPRQGRPEGLAARLRGRPPRVRRDALRRVRPVRLRPSRRRASASSSCPTRAASSRPSR